MGDQIWGAMAPGMSYLLAPAFRLGGIHLLIQINIALITVIALGVYEVGRRLTEDVALGVASAYVAVVAVPVWSSSFSLTPYSISIAAIVWSVAAAARAFESRVRSMRSAVVSGFLAGLATFCHLLVLPIALGLGLVFLWRRSRLALAYAGAASPAVIANALLNRHRFGSWNPVADGPCAWNGCPESGADPQSVGQMLVYGFPLFALLGLSFLGAYYLRHRPWASVLMVSIAILVTLMVPALREPAHRYALLTWAFLIDPGVLPLGAEYRPTADGFGVFVGPHAVKGLLQGSPFLALALLGVPWVKHRELLVVPVLAQLAMLILRANMPWDLALGHSFLSFRYLMPVAPLIAVLAVAAVRDLEWNLRWLALATVTAAVLRWWLSGPSDDLDLLRRRFLLQFTVAIAAGLLATTWLADRTAKREWARAAALLAAIALGVSAGVTMGVDFTATARFRSKNDHVVAVTQRHLPSRFALVAYPDELDAVLSLLPNRDIEYLDLIEVSDPSTVRQLTEYWQSQERPVYLRLPADPDFSIAPGLVANVVDPESGLLLVRTEPPSPSRTKF